MLPLRNRDGAMAETATARVTVTVPHICLRDIRRHNRGLSLAGTRMRCWVGSGRSPAPRCAALDHLLPRAPAPLWKIKGTRTRCACWAGRAAASSALPLTAPCPTAAPSFSSWGNAPVRVRSSRTLRLATRMGRADTVARPVEKLPLLRSLLHFRGSCLAIALRLCIHRSSVRKRLLFPFKEMIPLDQQQA